ncbi:Rhamnulose-1-phosphate aldolase [Klebsiella aerogenes]|nr:Rhamnulose-1-phosphate aldolase [Klebsiella aerogenes]
MHNIINSWFVQGMIKATSDAWLKGWDERNGGNLTLRLDEADIAPFKADFHPPAALYRLKPADAGTG